MYASNDDFDETKSLYKSSNHIAHYEQVTSSNFFNTINFLIYLKDPYKICGETCAQETLSSLNNLLELNLKYSITFDFLEFEKKKAIMNGIRVLFEYLNDESLLLHLTSMNKIKRNNR